MSGLPKFMRVFNNSQNFNPITNISILSIHFAINLKKCFSSCPFACPPQLILHLTIPQTLKLWSLKSFPYLNFETLKYLKVKLGCSVEFCSTITNMEW